MEQLAYERPREKLQIRGAAYLTTSELIQIIIGSGSMYVSGARLAKQVERLFAGSDWSPKDLKSIKGIGLAKSSQIIAAIELGRRITLSNKAAQAEVRERISPERIMLAMGKMRKLAVHVYFFSGSKEEVMENTYPIVKSEVLSLCVQRIVKDALEIGARSIVVAIGCRRDSLNITTTELSLIKQLHDATELISIALTTVYRANATTAERWSDL